MAPEFPGIHRPLRSKNLPRLETLAAWLGEGHELAISVENPDQVLGRRGQMARQGVLEHIGEAEELSMADLGSP